MDKKIHVAMILQCIIREILSLYIYTFIMKTLPFLTRMIDSRIILKHSAAIGWYPTNTKSYELSLVLLRVVLLSLGLGDVGLGFNLSLSHYI